MSCGAGPENRQDADHVSYFSSYESLYQQKSMLEDHVRMQAYYDGIMHNKACFKGRAVLDVGAGTGILSIWAARAGARKVYAVEATMTAQHARELVEANGVGDVVEVIQAKMEDIELPEKVDIIVSEWMGYFLVYESMLDTVIVARDKWLAEGGSLYPSHAQIFLAPLRSPDRGTEKNAGLVDCMDEWGSFLDETQRRYDVDMTPLSKPYQTECEKYFMRTANEWVNLSETDLCGNAAVIMEIDCNTVTVAELLEINAEFEMNIKSHSRLVGIAGWFEVHFRGSKQSPADESVTLSTAPSQGYTHWGHTCFTIFPSPGVKPGHKVHGSIHVTRKKEDERRLNVDIQFGVLDGIMEVHPTKPFLFALD